MLRRFPIRRYARLDLGLSPCGDSRGAFCRAGIAGPLHRLGGIFGFRTLACALAHESGVTLTAASGCSTTLRTSGPARLGVKRKSRQPSTRTANSDSSAASSSAPKHDAQQNVGDAASAQVRDLNRDAKARQRGTQRTELYQKQSRAAGARSPRRRTRN